MTLQPWQVQFGFSGPIFGAGTAPNLIGIPSGLRDLAPVRGGDVPRTMEDGYLPGLDFAGEKAVQFAWDATIAPQGTETAVASLAKQHAIVSDPRVISVSASDWLVNQATSTGKPASVMQVQLPGRASPFLLFGRPSKFSVPIDLNYGYGQARPVSEWTIPDGLIYDGSILTANCGLPNPTSGGTFNATFNYSFGASSGGSFQLVNAGNAYAPAVFTISGPCITPTVTNTATGAYITLNTQLQAGDLLVIDTKGQVVTLNGGTSLNSVVVIGSSFFKIGPGTNTIAYSTRDGAQVASVLTGYSLSAYSVA